MIAHVCHGQFFYTDSRDSKHWLQTHFNSLNQSYDYPQNNWLSYGLNKDIKWKNGHSFGAFIHLKNENKLRGVIQKSDLIGNGVLSAYRYTSPHIEIMNTMFLTDDVNNAERGFVRTIKNVTMYTNQAYLKMLNSTDQLKYSIKIGRDFLTIGHSLNSNLFVSDFSRPFDQFTLEADLGKLNALFSVIELDTMMNHNRYLYVHSFGYKSEKLSITLGESVLISGVSKSINIQFLNPFSFWSWENIGSTTKGLNALLYAGITWLPQNGLRIYGETIIDDINFHQDNAFYLNRFGFLIGLQKTGLPFKSSNLEIEYSNVLHQVYQSYHPTHIYTHRGFPIGHFIGNDFINIKIHYAQLMQSSKIKPIIDISYLMDGANGINTRFDNPWETEEGEFLKDYIPPSHPTSPVTTCLETEIGAEIKIKTASYLTITARHQLKSIEKESTTDMGIGIRFWSYFQLPFNK